jgi:hypothetical protein
MVWYGPWISLPDRTSVATLDPAPIPVRTSEDTEEVTAAQMLAAHSVAAIVDNAALAGARWVGGNLVYDYQQWEGNAGWTQTDVTPTDAFDPAAIGQDVDTSTFTTAVHTVDSVNAIVTPAVVGDTGDLTSSSVRVAFGYSYGVPRAESGGFPLAYTLHDIYTAPNATIPSPVPQGQRAYSAGPGTIAITGMSAADFALSGSGLQYKASVLGYVDRNDSPPLTITPPSGDHYVYWTLTLTTTITYTPLRFRNIYDARPPLAHRQRRDGTATTGPQLAHIGTAGNRPPLAWRQNTP